MRTVWATIVVLAFAVPGALLALVPERSKQERASIDRTKPTGRSVLLHKRVRQRLEQRRLLVSVYLGVVAVAVLVLVVWVLPSLLTAHPRIPNAADRHKAITDTRTGLVTMLAAIGAAGGLAYTARTYRLSRAGQITDRYSKAVALLGDEKIEVRLGGIYASERLMRDSPADQPTIMDTLAGFVRQHAPPVPRTVLPGRGAPPSAPNHPAEDIQAVLTVLRRRHPVDNERSIDLRRTNLTGADLSEATLTGADLRGAILTGADLFGANLTEAYLNGANLTDAQLSGANLTDADLRDADLTDAHLIGAPLPRANLSGATLTRARFNGANLTDAELSGANLTDADLRDADLTRANLFSATAKHTDFRDADLTDAELGSADVTDAFFGGATLTKGSLDNGQLATIRPAKTVTINWVKPPPQPPS